MEEKENRFAEASVSEIKMLVTDAVPRNTKKSTKYTVNDFEGKKNLRAKFGFSLS